MPTYIPTRVLSFYTNKGGAFRTPLFFGLYHLRVFFTGWLLKHYSMQDSVSVARYSFDYINKSAKLDTNIPTHRSDEFYLSPPTSACVVAS